MDINVDIHPSVALTRRIIIYTTVVALIAQVDETTALQSFARAILLGDHRSPMLVCPDCNLLRVTGTHWEQTKDICTSCIKVYRTKCRVQMPAGIK